MDTSKVIEHGNQGPTTVRGPEFREITRGKITINSGWDGDDYVWHLSSAHPKISFKVTEMILLKEIVSVLNKIIPNTCHVNIFTPYTDWNLKLYTFKAKGLKEYWQITDKILEDTLDKLFEKLNGLVN